MTQLSGHKWLSLTHNGFEQHYEIVKSMLSPYIQMVHGYIISWYPHVTLPVTSPVHQCPQLLGVITLPVAKEQARGGRRSCKPAQGFPGFPTCFLDLCGNGISRISPLQRMWNVYTLYMQCDVFKSRNKKLLGLNLDDVPNWIMAGSITLQANYVPNHGQKYCPSLTGNWKLETMRNPIHVWFWIWLWACWE